MRKRLGSNAETQQRSAVDGFRDETAQPSLRRRDATMDFFE